MSKTIAPVDTMLLMRRLADLTGGGMTLHRSIDVLRRQTTKGNLHELLRSVQGQLEEGQTLSHALSLQNGYFSPIHIGLIRAGESSGNVESALEESAGLLENEMETTQRIRAALAYPALLLVLAVAVCLFLTIFVIPRFEFLFIDLGQRLPLPTRLLISTSVFIKKVGWILALIAIVGGVLTLKSKPHLKGRFRDLFLKVPGISDLVRGTFLQRWAHVMGSLLKSGFTVSDALALSAKTLNSYLVSSQLKLVLTQLQEGHSLKSAMEASPLFPPMVCELVSAGEESGRLEETFFRIAQSYKRETELKSKLMLSLLEPILIVGMGLVVGFVAVAMLLPIFEISASFR